MSKKHLSPHDRFTRAMMTNKRVIEEFWTLQLSDDIKSLIDLSTIAPQKESFVDDKLRLNIADLLYSVNLKREPGTDEPETGYIYLLLEHQSTSDPLMPYRLVKYMIGIIDHHLKHKGGRTLPFIFPMVLYTGSRPYRHSMDFFDLFEAHKERARQVWLHPFKLIDLTQISDDELRRHDWYGTMALLLKHIHDRDILPLLRHRLEVMRKIEKAGESGYLYTVLSYVMEAAEVSSHEAFVETFKQLESLDKDKIMTMAEQFRQEGRQEGWQEGKDEASHRIAFNFMKMGLSLEQIAQATDLSLTELEQLKKSLQ